MAKSQAKGNDINKVVAWLIRIVGIVAIGFICFWAFFFFGFGKVPTSVGALKVGTLENPDEVAMEDATPFIEMQLLKNTDGSGKPLFEIAFNSYATQLKTKTKQQGIQIYGGFEEVTPVGKPTEFGNDDVRNLELIAEETSHFGFLGLGTNFNKFFDKKILNKTFIDVSYIGDIATGIASPAPVASDTKFLYTVQNENKSKTNVQLKFRGKVYADALRFSENVSGVFNFYNYYYAGLDNFLWQMKASCESLDAGTHWVYLDLSNYFDANYDLDNDGVFTDKAADLKLTYVLAKINISNQGCQRDSQSMFGKIQKEGSWNFDISDSAPFWKFENNVILNNDCFDLLPTANENEFVLSLKKSVVNKYANEKDLRINIEIDTTKFNKKVVGIASAGLLGLGYHDITIKTAAHETFTISAGNDVQVKHIYKVFGSTNIVIESNISASVGVKP